MGLIAAMAERNFQAHWKAWHNQPCPEVEEYEISGVTRCVTFEAMGTPEVAEGFELSWQNDPYLRAREDYMRRTYGEI